MSETSDRVRRVVDAARALERRHIRDGAEERLIELLGPGSILVGDDLVSIVSIIDAVIGKE